MICDLSWDCDSYSLAPWLVFTKIRKDVFFLQFFKDFSFSSFQNFKLSYFLLKANIHLLYFTILTKSNNFDILSNTIFYFNAFNANFINVWSFSVAANRWWTVCVFVCLKMPSQCLTEEGEQFLNGNLVKVSLCGDRMGRWWCWWPIDVVVECPLGPRHPPIYIFASDPNDIFSAYFSYSPPPFS